MKRSGGSVFNNITIELNQTDLKQFEMKMLLKGYTNFVQEYDNSQMERGLQDNLKLYIFLISKSVNH